MLLVTLAIIAVVEATIERGLDLKIVLLVVMIPVIVSAEEGMSVLLAEEETERGRGILAGRTAETDNPAEEVGMTLSLDDVAGAPVGSDSEKGVVGTERGEGALRTEREDGTAHPSDDGSSSGSAAVLTGQAGAVNESEARGRGVGVTPPPPPLVAAGAEAEVAVLVDADPATLTEVDAVGPVLTAVPVAVGPTAAARDGDTITEWEGAAAAAARMRIIAVAAMSVEESGVRENPGMERSSVRRRRRMRGENHQLVEVRKVSLFRRRQR